MRMRTLLFATIVMLLTGSSIQLNAQESTSYLVTWNPNPEPDIAHYILYRSAANNSASSVPIDTVNSSTTSYVDTGVQKGIMFFYWLRAMNASGDMSDFSNTVSAFTIPQDASDAVKNLCRITQKIKATNSSFDIGWSTIAETIGFVQYDTDQTLDSMSAWDKDQMTVNHNALVDNLLAPRTYYLRAVSYNASDAMFISALDTLIVEINNPTPLATPNLSIYPVPYHAGTGLMQFVDMPENGSVSIVSGSGLEVWHTSIGSTTSFTWNGMNSNGSPVMSGVYFAIVKDAKDVIVEKRPIMIVR